MRGAALSVALALVCGASALAEQPRLTSFGATELSHGEGAGIAVTSKGRLYLAPKIVPLTTNLGVGFPSQVFATVVDASGNVFLGTGPDGQVIRVSATGNATIHYRTDEPLVTALLPLPGGGLLAATAPGGKIYRIHPDGTGTVWSDTDERYVWALASRDDGTVLAATGDRGRLLKIDRNGNASILFDADETHLVSLAPASDGGVWAGGSGRGLVYRIDAEGHGQVVYDGDLPEAKALVVDRAGNLVVAFDAPPPSDKRPPAIQLRVAGGGATDAMTELDSRQAPALQGVIEGLSPAGDEDAARLRGRIVRLAPDGTSTDLWSSTSEAPFAVSLDTDGRPVFATGEPAKVWRVDQGGDVALLATLSEAQASALVAGSRGFVAATSNPAATYRLDGGAPDSGTFLALPADAGSVARWGTLRWRTEGDGGRVEFFTRTGNSDDPDATWSAWSPALTQAGGSAIPNPQGRYLQWRLRVSGASGVGLRVSGVEATYTTLNRPPSIRDLRLDPAIGSISAKATFRWSAADPDGDALGVDVQARKAGTATWVSAVRNDPPTLKPTDPTLGNDGSSKDGKAVWDTSAWDEGLYDIRAVATDQPANAAGEGLEATSELEGPLRVDRTPPAIEVKRGRDGGIDVLVSDAQSPVLRLEVIEGGRVVFAPRSADGVCDSSRETFRIAAAQAGRSGERTLKALDAAGNAAEAPIPSP